MENEALGIRILHRIVALAKIKYCANTAQHLTVASSSSRIDIADAAFGSALPPTLAVGIPGASVSCASRR